MQTTATDATIEKVIAIIKSDEFDESVAKKLVELKLQRTVRAPAGPGRKYVRDWFDRLMANGNLTASFFIGNYPAVINKESRLSSEMRAAVKYVCNPILFSMLLVKEKES